MSPLKDSSAYMYTITLIWTFSWFISVKKKGENVQNLDLEEENLMLGLKSKFLRNKLLGLASII